MTPYITFLRTAFITIAVLTNAGVTSTTLGFEPVLETPTLEQRFETLLDLQIDQTEQWQRLDKSQKTYTAAVQSALSQAAAERAQDLRRQEETRAFVQKLLVEQRSASAYSNRVNETLRLELAYLKAENERLKLRLSVIEAKLELPRTGYRDAEGDRPSQVRYLPSRRPRY